MTKRTRTRTRTMLMMMPTTTTTTAQRMSNEADDNYDGDDDDETLSERCGTDVQLLWLGYDCPGLAWFPIPIHAWWGCLAAWLVGWLHWWQRKAQLFICTMSEKCQAGAKGPKNAASSSSSPPPSPCSSSSPCMALLRCGLKRQLETKAIMMRTTLCQSFDHKQKAQAQSHSQRDGPR